MDDIFKKLACLLVAATFFVGGCSDDDTTIIDTEPESVTSLAPDTSQAPDKIPSDFGTKDPIELATATMATFAGKYDVISDIPQELIDLSKAMMEQSGEDGSKIADAINNGNMVMILNGDGTYIVTTPTPYEEEMQHGTWILRDDGAQITLSAPELEKDVPADHMKTPPGLSLEMVLTVSPNGKVLSLSDTQKGKMMDTMFIKR